MFKSGVRAVGGSALGGSSNSCIVEKRVKSAGQPDAD